VARSAIGAGDREAGTGVSTESLSDAIRQAGATGTALRITGAMSWMHAGRPSSASQAISVADERGIVDYVPDDLTMTVRAGTTLRDIDTAARANDQWLPLDPYGSEAGTIGATIATGSSGPLSHGFGAARDFLLGIEFVNGKGATIRAGGRVVKNVAGFDLMRLLCGSWGTLGVITEVTLRLYAVPKRERSVVFSPAAGRASDQDTIALLRNSPIAPVAMELIDAKLAAVLGLPARDCVLIRLAGNEAVVAKQAQMLGEIGMLEEVGGDAWLKLRELDREAPIGFRISGLPAEVASLWDSAGKIFAGGADGWMHSTLSRGVVRVVARRADMGALVASIRALPSSSRTIFEVLPGDAWRDLSPNEISSRLSRSVKSAFDPLNILNPGVLGD
jgi:glycolate oxidase FAD binding subunit